MAKGFVVRVVDPPAIYEADHFPRTFRYEKEAKAAAQAAVDAGAVMARVEYPNGAELDFLPNKAPAQAVAGRKTKAVAEMSELQAIDRLTKYVIYDTEREGWAENNPIEGWCFNRMFSQAHVFPSYEKAREVADLEFNPGRAVRVSIEPATESAVRQPERKPSKPGADTEAPKLTSKQWARQLDGAVAALDIDGVLYQLGKIAGRRRDSAGDNRAEERYWQQMVELLSDTTEKASNIEG